MHRLASLLRACVLVTTGSAVFSCDAHPPSPSPQAPRVTSAEDISLGGKTMGSTWTVKIAVDSTRSANDAIAMQAPIDALLERVNDAMSTYRPASEISRFNQHRSTDPFAVSPDLALVVERALDIGRATLGAYDITLDPLINLWGFDKDGRRTAPPTPAQITKAKAHTGLDRIRVDQGRLTKVDPEVTINLGGIASGFAVDAIAQLLDERGFRSYMVEVTGEVRVRGKNARDAPWKIGIKTPRSDSDPTAVLAAVPLVDRALTTSGSYHNFFESGGTRYSHILDPATGAPIRSTLVSVTVLADNALTADGYDTAFMILGETRAREIIERTPGLAALFIHAEPGAAKATLSFTEGFPPIEEMPR